MAAFLTSSSMLMDDRAAVATITDVTVRVAARREPLVVPIALPPSKVAVTAADLHEAVVIAVANAANVYEDEVSLFVRVATGHSSKMVSLAEYLILAKDGDEDGIMADASVGFLSLYATLRLRGGKGKAGFQKNLQRKGREYTRAVRAGHIQNAGTMAVAAARQQDQTHRRHNDNGLNTTRDARRAAGLDAGHPHRRFGGASTSVGGHTFLQRRGPNGNAPRGSHFRDGDKTLRGSHGSALNAETDVNVVSNLPPDHPVEILKRDQARERAQMAMWASRMAAAVESGLGMMVAAAGAASQ